MLQDALESAMKLCGTAVAALGLPLVAACASAERDDNYSHWEVAAVGVADDCNTPPGALHRADDLCAGF